MVVWHHMSAVIETLTHLCKPGCRLLQHCLQAGHLLFSRALSILHFLQLLPGGMQAPLSFLHGDHTTTERTLTSHSRLQLKSAGKGSDREVKRV